ncbi:hypothetical protein BH10CYA1_BH10CYA1_16440 [soil metagenome]
MTTDGVRLGDLLTGAGLLQASDLREAMMISKQQGLPVGRVLIMSGYLTEQHLQAAVQAQSLLKDGLIEFGLVIKALTMVGAEDITLEEAFKRLKWNQQSDAVTNKLGELLLAADIVPIDALNAALLQCQSIGLPLGRVLIGNGVLTEQMLAATLNAQVFIRDKKLTREQAIQGLRSAKERQIPIEQYLAETGAMSLPMPETVRLGELFVLAGIVDEPNLMGAVEVGLLNEQPLGQVLLQSAVISQEILDAALDLQAMVGAGAIKKDEAAKFLGTVKNKNVSVGEAIAIAHQKPSTKKKAAATAIEEPPMPVIEPLPLYQFLQLSGIITAKEIEQAIRVGSKDTQIMASMLRMSGVMEKSLVDAAEKCNDLIGAGVLNHEQGMIVLKNCERNNFTLEQAFNELGWNTAPLRADPGVPEFLLDTPQHYNRNAYDNTLETTAQMSEARTAEQDSLSLNASDAAQIEMAEPALPFSQPGPADAITAPMNPLGAPPAALETAAAVESGWPSPAVTPNPLDSQPASDSSSEAAALADFGSSINQQAPAVTSFAQPAAAASSVEAADSFGGSAGEWHAASPDEWMPKPAAPEQPAAQAAAAAIEAPAASDPWQAGGQAQMTSDAWQGGQAQHAQPQAAPAPEPQQPQQPAATADWQAGPAPQPQESWSQPATEVTQAPQSDWASGQPAAPPDWTPVPTQPAQPQTQPAAAQGDWAAPPQVQPAAPAQQADWANTSATSMPAASADWANSVPTQAAPAVQPAASEWQPPTTAAPQEAGWQGPPDPGAEWQAPAAQPGQAQAAQPPAPAPVQPGWQSAAPSPLPGWQSTSTNNQDAWQPMPASPAAQMFQEAAQSLQSTPPVDGQQPPAAAPAPEHSAPQGPMDLFADSEDDHSDPSDKPKKRLSDLMPKFGQKS